jgi:hypothetical protein
VTDAVSHYYKLGYTCVDNEFNSRLMTRVVDGIKLGEVIINREGYLDVVAECIEQLP